MRKGKKNEIRKEKKREDKRKKLNWERRERKGIVWEICVIAKTNTRSKYSSM